MTKENMQKYCTKCGKEISQNSKFCVSCGNGNNEVNKVKNNSTPNTGKVLVVLLMLFLILTIVFSSLKNTGSPVTRNEEKKTGYLAEKYKEEIEKDRDTIQTVEKLLEEYNSKPKIDSCSGENKLTFLEKNYKLYNPYSYDRDIGFYSNRMKVYGIIKNDSSKCSAAYIKLKVLLIKGENVMQEEIIDFSDPINNIIYPNRTKEFSVKFEVYESLLNVGKNTETKRLKPDIKVNITIVSVDLNYKINRQLINN